MIVLDIECVSENNSALHRDLLGSHVVFNGLDAFDMPGNGYRLAFIRCGFDEAAQFYHSLKSLHVNFIKLEVGVVKYLLLDFN